MTSIVAIMDDTPSPTTATTPWPDDPHLARAQRAIERCTAEPRPAGRRRMNSLTPVDRDTLGDETLVRAALDGDERSFRELFARHAGAVRMAIGDRVRDRDRQDDLVQETFLRGFSHLSSLREPERIRPWLLQIARNLAIDEVRRTPRTGLRHEVDVDLDGVPTAVRDEPAEAFELHLLRQSVEAGLAALSPRDNRVLTMSAHLGLGLADIANELGVTNGTAKVILHRARRRLLAAIA